MQAAPSELKHKKVTDKILGAFYKVYGNLGYGFEEKVYENPPGLELRRAGLQADQQQPIEVYYEGETIGTYFADLLVANSVLVELQSVRTLTSDHEAQLLNYLKATSYEVGLLLNFGPKPTFTRKAFDNSRKGSLAWTRRP